MSRRQPTGHLAVASVQLNLDDLVVNTDDAAAAKTATEASAVESLTIKWGRSHPHGHDEPGELVAILRLDRPGAVTVDTRVQVRVQPAGWPVGNTIHLGQAWVEAVSYHRITGSSVWRYVLTCTSWLGRAAAARLRSAPWPEGQALHQRLDAINAAASVDLVDALSIDRTGPAGSVAARDVDNASALDVVQETANTWGLLVTEGVSGLLLYHPPGNRFAMPALLSGGATPRLELLARPAAEPLELPAGAVQDRPRELARQGYLTDVVVEFKVKNTTTGEVSDASRRWRAPGSAGRAGSQLTITTDYQQTEADGFELDPATAYVGPAGDRAAALTADPVVPRPLLEPVRVLLDRLAMDQVRLLLALADRSSTVWRLTSAPVDLDPIVVVVGATLTIAGGWMGLEVKLAPLVLTGVRPLRWADFPDDTLAPAVIQGDLVPARFAHTHYDAPPTSPRVRLGDTELALAPNDWR